MPVEPAGLSEGLLWSVSTVGVEAWQAGRLKKIHSRGWAEGQWITVPAANPPNLSSVPESHLVKGREPTSTSHPLTLHKIHFALAE